MKENILLDKSKLFALRIIKLYKYLCDNKHEYILSKQLLKSGTSIGANTKESVFAQSKADFIAKLFKQLFCIFCLEKKHNMHHIILQYLCQIVNTKFKIKKE